jgi:hypothetical protein
MIRNYLISWRGVSIVLLAMVGAAYRGINNERDTMVVDCRTRG